MPPELVALATASSRRYLHTLVAAMLANVEGNCTATRALWENTLELDPEQRRKVLEELQSLQAAVDQELRGVVMAISDPAPGSPIGIDTVCCRYHLQRLLTALKAALDRCYAANRRAYLDLQSGFSSETQRRLLLELDSLEAAFEPIAASLRAAIGSLAPPAGPELRSQPGDTNAAR